MQPVTPCKSSLIPCRWNPIPRQHTEALADLRECGHTLAVGTEALCGLYLRICDMIRIHQFTDLEVRQALSPSLPPPRVSEILRVSRAEPEVYRRYRAGLVGFKATLAECRGYRVHSSEFLVRRKIRRAAERLVQLLGTGEVTVSGRRVVVF